MKTITKRPKLALYIIAVCLCGLISIFGPGYVTTQRAKRGLLTRTVSKTENSAITEIWRLDDVVITLNAPSTPLIATKDQLFIYGDIGSLNGRLLKLDPANGTIISDETPGTFALPLSFTTVDTVAYDADNIYLGYEGIGHTQPNSTVASGGLAAYHLDSETVAWTRTLPGTRTIQSLIAESGFVLVDSTWSASYHLVSSSDGSVAATLARETYPQSSTAVSFLYAQISPLFNTKPDIQDRQKEIAFWQDHFLRVNQPPLLLQNVLLIQTTTFDTFSLIKAVDRQTGEQLWELPDRIISNMVASGDKVFALNASAELIMLDPVTGQKIESINFSDEAVQREATRGFFVAASSDKLYVYFGDSRQLFAFEFALTPANPNT